MITNIQVRTKDGVVLTGLGDGALWNVNHPIGATKAPQTVQALEAILWYAPHLTLRQLEAVVRAVTAKVVRFNLDPQAIAKLWLGTTDLFLLDTLRNQPGAVHSLRWSSIQRLLRYGFVEAPYGLGEAGIDDAGKIVQITEAGKFARDPRPAHFRDGEIALCDSDDNELVEERERVTCLACQKGFRT